MLHSSQMVQMRLSVFFACMTGALALKLQSSSVEPNTFVGGGGKDLSTVQCICTEEEPVCLFQNLCYDKKEKEWAFHIAPDSDAPSFPDGISLIANEFLHAHPGQHQGRTGFKPQVVRSNERQQVTDGVYGLLDGAPFGNMGHILGDQTWPFFQAARHFDLNPRDVKILTTFQPLENQGGVYESLNGHSEINSLQGGKFCVSKLLAGIGGLGYSSMMKYPDEHGATTGERMKCLKEKPFDSEFSQFSTYLAQRCAAVAQPQPHQLRILLTRKDVGHSDHEQILGNTDEISEHLRQRFPHADVQVVTWMGMPLEEQVRLVASTDIFISLPGSDVMNGAFLLNNTEMIVPCRYAGWGGVDGLWNSGEVDNWFKWASHIKAVEICSEHARTRHNAWGNQIPTGRNWTTSEKGKIFSVIIPVEDIDVHVDAAVARLRAKGAIV